MQDGPVSGQPLATDQRARNREGPSPTRSTAGGKVRIGVHCKTVGPKRVVVAEKEEHVVAQVLVGALGCSTDCFLLKERCVAISVSSCFPSRPPRRPPELAPCSPRCSLTSSLRRHSARAPFGRWRRHHARKFGVCRSPRKLHCASVVERCKLAPHG